MTKLLEALGVTSEGEALSAISLFTGFLNEARSATGQEAFADVVATIKANAEIVADLESQTEATGKAALAAVAALKETAEAGKAAQDELEKVQLAARDAEAKTLIEAARADGRLPPARVDKANEIFAKYELDGLKLFLEALSPVVAMAQTDGRQERKVDKNPTDTFGINDEPADADEAKAKKIRLALGLTEKQAAEFAKLDSYGRPVKE